MRHRVGAADRVELVDDRSDVKLGRVDRDREPSRDGLVRRALSEQHEHLKFARGERNVDRCNFLSDPRRPIEFTLRAMMTTRHLGDRPHPVVASAARELLNKSENERSGVLSTAMSFLGLYRDPVVAKVTSRCDWRIGDLVQGERPATLYLVVPPSDISRTKPLVRLVLNQIGRRLTEDLQVRCHRILLMLDEFPALGRLDFFESALAFMGRGRNPRTVHQILAHRHHTAPRRRTSRRPGEGARALRRVPADRGPTARQGQERAARVVV